VHPNPGGAVAGRVDGDLVLDGLSLREPRDGRLVALARTRDGERLAIAPAEHFERSSIAGLDPTLGLAHVTGTAPVGAFELRLVPNPDAAAIACRRALAYELIGLATTMLDLAAEYARGRHQFGQPIGTFQAVKHRLADVLVALSAARVAADEWWDADTDDDEFAAAVAKCLAGRAFRLAAENCLQVMGAIGFTLEHGLHSYIERGTVLEMLFGSARELRIEIGRALLQRGRVPRPGVL